MAPKKQVKTATTAVPTKIASPSRTPSRSPIKKRVVITAAQKQALIDNLQLEITERARKLRAQYALHAQGLRSRLEMRLNRIPQSLRNMNIEELINKSIYDAFPTKNPNPPAPAGLSRSKAVRKEKPPVISPSSPPERAAGRKRLSNEMSSDDKENANVENDLNLPKKRAKATATTAMSKPASATSRQPSRKANSSQVLSPKSHNSRTLPASPVKAKTSPTKSMLARPASPVKPVTTIAPTARVRSTAKTGAPLPRTNSKQNMAPPPVPAAKGKRTATTTSALKKKESSSRLSDKSITSDSSNATTIIKTAKVAKKPAKKGGIVSTVAKAMNAATGRKPVASKDSAAPATGGRVLRSRR